MGLPFGDWMERLIAGQATVAIGEGDSALQGTITAYDERHGVVTFQTGRTSHFIPLTSIRSFGMDEKADGAAHYYMELFKR